MSMLDRIDALERKLTLHSSSTIQSVLSKARIRGGTTLLLPHRRHDGYTYWFRDGAWHIETSDDDEATINGEPSSGSGIVSLIAAYRGVSLGKAVRWAERRLGSDTAPPAEWLKDGKRRAQKTVKPKSKASEREARGGDRQQAGPKGEDKPTDEHYVYYMPSYWLHSALTLGLRAAKLANVLLMRASQAYYEEFTASHSELAIWGVKRDSVGELVQRLIKAKLLTRIKQGHGHRKSRYRLRLTREWVERIDQKMSKLRAARKAGQGKRRSQA